MRMAVVVEKASDLANIYFFEFDGSSSDFAVGGLSSFERLLSSEYGQYLLRRRDSTYVCTNFLL